MKVMMNVIDVSDLDEYIDEKTVPFTVCVPTSGVTSKRQLKFLDQYYDKVVDKRGWISYYCNIVNPRKCLDNDYTSIQLNNGFEKDIKTYKLEKNEKTNGYVVSYGFKNNEKMDAISLIKTIRLDVETVKKSVNLSIKR